MSDAPVVLPSPAKELPRRAIAIALAIALGAGSLGWFYFVGPCGVSSVQRATKDLTDIAQRWDDAESIASSTARIALAAPVSTLQSIRSETQKLDVPKCMEEARTNLADSMDATIGGYLAFMQNQSDYAVNVYFVDARDKTAAFGEALAAVRACAPWCQ